MDTLVIGATGKVGRQVATALQQNGNTVRSASRHPEDSPAGTQPTLFDWDDRQTWAPAHRGVDAMFVVGPYTHPDSAQVLEDLLTDAVDVRRVVLLSSMAAEAGDGSTNGEMERVVMEHAREWTVLRSTWFSQNFTENLPFVRGIAERGELLTSLDDTAVSFVDTRDLGEVAAAALSQPQHAGRTYDVTGPRAITMNEVAAELSRASGRDVRYPRRTPADNAAVLAEMGLPAPLIEVLGYVDEATRGGAFTPVAETVPTVLGRPARDFTTFASEVFATS